MKRVISTIMILSICFSSELENLNKFSYNKLSSNLGSLELEIGLESSVNLNGYQRITGSNSNHTIDEGLPELPTYTTFYQLDPEKEYEVELIIHDSYTVEDIIIYPYQGNNKEGNPFLVNSCLCTILL